MSSYISDNDDDLFDYNPETDTEEVVSENVIETESSNNSYSDLENDIINHFNKINKNDDHVTTKAKLAIAFHSATTSFTKNSIADESYIKSLTTSLDILTEGQFSLLVQFNRTEMRIAKRMQFIKLFGEAMSQEVEDNVLTELFNLLKINLTEQHIDTCYRPSFAMCKHALILDRAEYLQLSEMLSIPVNQILFKDVNEIENDNELEMSLSSFENKINKTIKKALDINGVSNHIESLSGIKAKLKTFDES